MSFEEKYAVSKRRKQIGTFTAREIIRLLKTRELSTIHKVKVEDKEITVGEFASAHEAGELPKQNVAEVTPEETKPKETKSKKAEKVTPKVSPSSTPPVKPKPAPSPPPSTPKSAKPTSAPKPIPTAPPPTLNDSLLPSKGTGRKPLRPLKAKEDSRQTISLAKRNENSGSKKDGPKIKRTGTTSSPLPKKRGLGESLLRKALLIGTFVVIAYGCASLLNHQKMKSEIESLFQQSSPIDDIEVSEFTLEGHYLIHNQRKATVEILRNGKEARTYHFKVSGNGITSRVQMEME